MSCVFVISATEMPLIILLYTCSYDSRVSLITSHLPQERPQYTQHTLSCKHSHHLRIIVILFPEQIAARIVERCRGVWSHHCRPMWVSELCSFALQARTEIYTHTYACMHRHSHAATARAVCEGYAFATYALRAHCLNK